MTRIFHRFTADDDRLETEIGIREQNLIRILGGKKGTALYGPYINLPAGSYGTVIRFDSGTPFRGTATMDVCSGSGAEGLARQIITAEQIVDQGMSASLEFFCSHELSGVEVRLVGDTDFVAGIESIEIFGDEAQSLSGASLKLSDFSAVGVENISTAAEVYCQALKIGSSLNDATIELDALRWREGDLPRNASPAFEGESELGLLLAAVRASHAAEYPLLVSNPVFALSGKVQAGPELSAASTVDQLSIIPGPLKFETRADSAVLSELDPAYADEDIPLTRHMTHTWHRFEMRSRFHLNSDKSRLAFIVWYYLSRRYSVGAVPAKLVTALNFPVQAHGPLTQFLFGIWRSEYQDQTPFNVQQEDGYINFLTEVVGRRASAKHIPDELLPNLLLNTIHQPAIGDSPHRLSKAAYSIWQRLETHRTKYNNIDDWRVRQAFNFDLIIHDLGANSRSRLISSDTISFWSGPISHKFPNLSRFAAALAHVSRRFGKSAAASPIGIARNAPAIAAWFEDEIVQRFPRFAIFLTTPPVSREAQPALPQSRSALRAELRESGIDYIDHFPGEGKKSTSLLSDQ